MGNDIKVGHSVKHRPNQFVQTERKAHEAWADLIARKPKAAALAHHLVANMGSFNAVVVSQGLLAKLMNCSVRTVQTAVSDLVNERWIEVVRLGRGKEAAYIVNDRVAWGQARKDLQYSRFAANVMADYADQKTAELTHGDLRKVPTLFAGEKQVPDGGGLPPPSQPALDGLEPDLPTRAEVDEQPDPWADVRNDEIYLAQERLRAGFMVEKETEGHG